MAKEIKLKPSKTSYREFIKQTAEATKNPKLLKKLFPNERVLRLVRSDETLSNNGSDDLRRH